MVMQLMFRIITRMSKWVSLYTLSSEIAINSVSLSDIRRSSLSVDSMLLRTLAFSNIICKQYNTQATSKVIVLLCYGERQSTTSEDFRSCIIKLLYHY